MRRIGALIAKELVQHGWTLLALAVFLPAIWGLLVLLVLAAPTTVTYVEAHATMVRFFVPLTALALGNRLVVAEYHGRTQLYLEALPMGRVEMFAVKLGLGLVILETIALGSLAGTLAVAAAREPVDPMFVLVLAVRTATFVLALWSFLFAMGFLGRMRTPIYVTLAIVLPMLAATTELELMRFGPFALVGPDLPLERDAVPAADVAVTLGIALAWLALALGLATIREGSLAETLAKPMSQREKVAISIALFSLVLVWTKLDPPDPRQPFVFPDRGIARSDSLPIEVLYAQDDARDDAEALIARLERELEALRRALGWDTLPTIRVALAERLDGRTFEPVELGDDDGILVRANFVRGPEWDEDAFVTEIVGRAIDDHTDGRARWEPLEWVRDGLAGWWPHRDRGELPPATVRRALWATRSRGPDASRLAAWDRTRESEGLAVAEALATTGMHVLAIERGPDAVRALGRALFEGVPSETSIPVIDAWLRPLPHQLREHAGIEQGALLAAWSRWLETQGARGDLDLAGLPRGMRATLAVEQSAGGTHDVVARLHAESAPPPGSTVALLHFGIGPFDTAIEPWEPRREQRVWPEGERELELRIEGRYAPGERVWIAIDLENGTGDTLRLAQLRAEVP